MSTDFDELANAFHALVGIFTVQYLTCNPFHPPVHPRTTNNISVNVKVSKQERAKNRPETSFVEFLDHAHDGGRQSRRLHRRNKGLACTHTRTRMVNQRLLLDYQVFFGPALFTEFTRLNFTERSEVAHGNRSYANRNTKRKKCENE